jgi:hypothetical protein
MVSDRLTVHRDQAHLLQRGLLLARRGAQGHACGINFGRAAHRRHILMQPKLGPFH